MRTSEDWWAIWCAGLLLIVGFIAVWMNAPDPPPPGSKEKVSVSSPLKPWLSKPSTWRENPLHAFYTPVEVVAQWEQEAAEAKKKANAEAAERWGEKSEPKEAAKPEATEPEAAKPEAAAEKSPPKPPKAVNTIYGTLGSFLVIGLLFAGAIHIRGQSARKFLTAFPVVFALATVAYVLSGQSVIKAYNLEYALWALLVGLIISNTIGTPKWLGPAVLTEFYIKTGLVLLGAEVLMSRLVALGLPGVFVAWVVTPIVLITTYIFGQKVLKMESRSLNMVIAADMSVCGVSAAIATAAACKAKKEELSLAIGLSLSFTVVMMVVLPMVIKFLDLSPTLGGAWLGGTIDATGAVAAAGATLGDEALEVASAVKMIQNILIGVTAFCVAVYWVTSVERDPSAPRPSAMEIWYRFPKFVIGFVVASIVFSILHAVLPLGPEMVSAMIKDSTKTIRSWLFCMAFVSIGLQTNFRELMPYFKGGKPMILYVCGQSLNLILTLAMAWLMFEVVFKDVVSP
ncbi:YeiH family protein [Stieleria varia]|nr:putative sulfate exporter family transporter [Stieleria varia]